MEESGEVNKLKSQNDLKSCWVCFVNRTAREVDIIWIDYKGAENKYITLKPKQYFRIKTFLTHPWIFREHNRRDKLFAINKNHHSVNNNDNNNNDDNNNCNHKSLLNNVFLPKPSESNTVQIVDISNGLYSLKERCFQELFDKIPDTYDFDSLEIPKSLITEYRNYLNICKAL